MSIKFDITMDVKKAIEGITLTIRVQLKVKVFQDLLNFPVVMN